MNVNLLNDLATLTQTKQSLFEYLRDISVQDISQSVLEAYNTDGEVELDIGIGCLYISVANDELKFNFTPSADLEKQIINSIDSGKSYLQEVVESRIGSRMAKLYKELI